MDLRLSTRCLLLCLIFFSAISRADSSAPVLTPQILTTHSHAIDAFTEGLVWENGQLYESTGEFGLSTLSVRDAASGRILRAHKLNKKLFGEGIALVGSEIIQLTWKNHRAYVYDKATLRLKRSLHYPREGWGLSYDGRYLIASDGSATLYFLQPKTLRVVRRLEVRDGDQPVTELNELEYIDGEIFANIFDSDRIARISVASGMVLSWLDLSTLYPQAQRPESDVLNGIAYDRQKRHLLVTGKHWPKLYEIALP